MYQSHSPSCWGMWNNNPNSSSFDTLGSYIVDRELLYHVVAHVLLFWLNKTEAVSNYYFGKWRLKLTGFFLVHLLFLIQWKFTNLAKARPQPAAYWLLYVLSVSLAEVRCSSQSWIVGSYRRFHQTVDIAIELYSQTPSASLSAPDGKFQRVTLAIKYWELM